MGLSLPILKRPLTLLIPGVDHAILITKMKRYGLNEPAIRSFKFIS